MRSCHNILHNDLKMHGACQYIVPKMMSADQKEIQIILARDFITVAIQDKNLLNNILTGDQIVVFVWYADEMRIIGMEIEIISNAEILFGQEQRKNYVGNIFFVQNIIPKLLSGNQILTRLIVAGGLISMADQNKNFLTV